MTEVVTNLRRCPVGYYVYYVHTARSKWMYFLEATPDKIYILKAYRSSRIDGRYQVHITFIHEERCRMTLTTGKPDGILFEIDKGDFMLELSEEI